jgi:hypothetical protein
MQALLQKENNKYNTFWVRVSSLRYPVRSASYCHMWPARLYSIFTLYIVNGTIFEKKILNITCVFSFSVQILSETFFILRRTERDMVINVYLSSCKIPLILVRF